MAITKRTVYIAAFAVCGFLVQFLLHAVIELWYTGLLLNNFSVYGFGWSWQAWFRIHSALSIIFAVGGIWFGIVSGAFWWPRLYDAKGHVRFKRWWRV